jgi:hypothetical protein
VTNGGAVRIEEGATWLRLGTRYRTPLFARQFPPELPFGFLGRVLPTTEPLEMTVEAHRISPRAALEMIHGARAVAEAELAEGRADAATPELEAERATAEELGRALARRTQELWRVGVRWVASSGVRPRAEAARARLAERLQALGFRVRVPRFEVAAALAPVDLTPGPPRPSGYWQTLPTDGLAALYPFGDESIVEPRGILLGLGLADASPVFLDRWAHASYSWGIFGTTGSGKTFAAALALLRSRWMQPALDAVVLDPLGEFSGLVRALDGDVLALADGRSGRLNPLDPVTTGGDRREKAARVGAMLRALFPSLRDEESALVDSAVSALLDSGRAVPTLGDLAESLATAPSATERLRSLFEVFRTGSLRDLNGPTTLRSDARLVAVDFRGVAVDQLAFHLTYVLDWALGRMRERPGPKLLVVDEAHLLAHQPATAEFLDRVVRHVRHFEAGVLVLSQSPDDFLTGPSGRAMLRNLYAIGLLRLPEVSAEARAFFGLTAAEAGWLPKARLPREAGYAESLWRIGELHLPLALVASTPEYEFLCEALAAGEASRSADPAAGPRAGL